jgi:hypothetical protein
MSDYLWDPSGDADPEVEEFEEALSAIRYRAGTSELPERLENALRMRRPKRLPWLLAAAAALAFVLFTSGLWLSWRPNQRRALPTQQAVGSNENSTPLGTSPGSETKAPPRGDEAHEPRETAQVGKSRRDVLSNGPARKQGEASAGGNKTGRRKGARSPAARTPGRELYVSDAASGEAAKAQIMLALQITSSKLGLAQRMAQKNAVP